MEPTTEGTCHCGAVRITVPDPPETVTECHCSICRRYGGLWAYYPTVDVALTGPTDDYLWGRKRIAFRRCRACGCVLGWWPRSDYPECGVNARLIDGFDSRVATRVVEDDASV